jgi:hypothetical protein
MTLDERRPWTEVRLEALLGDELSRFERKSGSLFDTESDLLGKLAKELSAFANSGGGYIVLGVDDNGVPDGVPPTRSARTSTRDWLEQKIPYLVDRPLTDFNVHVVAPGNPSNIPPGKQVIVIEVDDSPIAPHQAVHGGGGTQKYMYFHRQAGRSEPAPHRILEQLHQRQLAAKAVVAAERSAQAAERTAETMARQRMDASQPLVVGKLRQVELDERGRLFRMHCELYNIGNGPALSVRARLSIYGVEYTLMPESEGCPWELAPQTTQTPWHARFQLRSDEPGPQRIAKSTPGTAVLTITYLDVNGRRFEGAAEFSVPFHAFSHHLEQTKPLTLRYIDT